MNFNLETILSDRVDKIANGEVAVETSVAAAEEGIERILTLVADSRILSVEAAGGDISVSGRVNFKLMYLTKSGQMKNLDYFSDFVEKLAAEDATGRLFAKSKVLDTSVTANGTIKLTAVVELSVYAVRGEVNRCLQHVDDSIYAEIADIPVQTCTVSGKEALTLADERQLKTQVESILLFDNRVLVTDVNAGMGNVLISGKAVATVTYLADGEVNIAEFQLPFSEEVENEQFVLGQKVSAFAEVRSGKVILSGVEGDNTLGVEIGVDLSLRAFGRAECAVVRDIYSTLVELDVETMDFTESVFCGAKSCASKITGSVSLDDDMAPLRDIIGVTSARNNLAKVFKGEDEQTPIFIIEGIVTASVLYIDENGINSLEANIPYSESFDADGEIADSAVIFAEGMAASITAKARRDKEITLEAEIVFRVEGENEYRTKLINGVTEGEEKEQNRSAVSVFIAEEGEGIWEAAKALSARPDQIVQQNPEIEFPFKGGEKVVFYRQLSTNF